MKELRLTPINPFTDKQQVVIEHRLRGLTIEQTAQAMHISPYTVKNHICGTIHTSELTQSDLERRSQLGILGIIEGLTGKRPSAKGWLPKLIGDVVLEVYPQGPTL